MERQDRNDLFEVMILVLRLGTIGVLAASATL